MTDPVTRLNAALQGRYRIKPELAAVVGAERFLVEIKTTANLQHPHILPLHDSGEAEGSCPCCGVAASASLRSVR